MKFFITFGVPRNTGDLALLESLCYLIGKKYPQAVVVVSTDFPELKIDSKLRIENIWDYESGLFLDKNIIKAFLLKFLQKLSWKLKINEQIKLYAFWTTNYTRYYFQRVNDADKILLAPGGYLNSYYDLEFKLHKILKLLKMGKDILIVNQSIGPINLAHQKIFIEILRKIKNIILREKISYSNLHELGLNNIMLSTDCAFILHEKYKSHFIKKSNKSIVHIAMSVREWQKDGNEIKEKYCELIEYIFQNHKGVSITFISTCQGLESYTDDTKLARDIVDQLDGYNIKVNSNYHSPLELIKVYQKYDLYIGMRMHGGILAMLAGTPAILIGYEKKSEGVLENMQISHYHFYYHDEMRIWKKNTSEVFKNYVSICENLEADIVSKAHLVNKIMALL